ncbi:hypothetical protein Pmar_PMAR006224 [Perkinsus marinus ATCC 50983]|uniref:Ferric reductase NAD binding domain-containing protein n=1 Tax=Perkinsus marinus (strain ATCC 50983 / TXsc) TaxID=423536 RepID=C5LAF8_PERM5|nr:hypothetical protein Pmar_PMAR006224 [Perkinsus marinus ATCC 50983]EER06414.1 hypothetical protein Pmar_PMAR006224 [Perkinsus marinus ATCC 50983]|eukprot:XP_002774598.1 hypothetical protein Pmar_PMAR006224 [Perkinsus marinus ATCC 50983]
MMMARCEERPDDLPRVKLDGPFCAPAQSIKADFMGPPLVRETAPKRSSTKKWWSKQSASTRDLEYTSDLGDSDDDDLERGQLDGTAAQNNHCGCSQDDVIVCIGAGVGITPFLSSLDAMLKKAAAHKASGEHEEICRNKKVWFYWLTRNAGDFLSGVSILRQLSAAASRMLHNGDTGLAGLIEVHLRLHVTAAVGSATASTPSDEENK